MLLPRVRAGEPLLADRQNQLLDVVNRLVHGTADPRPETSIALFELASMFVYPGGSRCPYCDDARRVWFDHEQSRYTSMHAWRAEVIHYPTALRWENGSYVGLPLGRIGDRLWCLWNRQSGRWEVLLANYQNSFHGRLLGEYPGMRTVLVLQGIYSTGIAVEADCLLLKPGEILPVSTKVKIEWFPEERKFYITGAECEG